MIPITKLTGRMGNQMFQYAYLYNQVKKGLIPDIYVQDPELFEESKAEIIAQFSIDIVSSDYVAIHVRRGDYVDNPFYVDLSKTDYYQKAMAEFPDREFLVFSDDIKWCKQYFGMYNPKIRFSEEKSEVADFNKMAGCDGIIIANSSFSYWAAYLNKGKVIAPLAWYSDGIERTKLPLEWKRI